MIADEETPPQPPQDEADRVVEERLASVRHRLLEAGGEQVKLLAVTKGFGPDVLARAHRLGLSAVGENYAQELEAKVDALSKADKLPADLEIHFIGQLQSKRVRTVAHLVSVWQSVDRLKVARQIATHAPGARIMVQVNATGEPQKAGCEPADVADLVEQARDLGLRVEGLMTVGRSGSDEDTSAAFRMVNALADDLGLVERSMGMSGDLELAVAEGSTMVRIGSALFGPRGTPIRG